MKVRKSKVDSTIACPHCRPPNPAEFIYCADSDCIVLLHPGRINCGSCRAAIPVNARSCPDCGHATDTERIIG